MSRAFSVIREWLSSLSPTVAILAIAAAFVGIVSLTLLEMREENWRRANQAALNVNRAITEELEHTISSLDLSLQAVVEGLQMPEVVALDPMLRNLVLFDRSATAKNLSTILVINENGQVTIDSRTGRPRTGSYADREYFRAQRDNPKAGRFISAPYQGRETPEWLFAVSRRLAASSAGFSGIVVGTLRLAPLRTFLTSFDLGPHSTVTIMREDGAIIMRLPFAENLLSTNVWNSNAFQRSLVGGEGQFIATSALDGVRRLNTFRRVPGTSLIVAVSLAVADIESNWWQQSLLVGTATLILVCGLGIASQRLRCELRQRQLAEAIAHESEANFRLLAENSSDMVTRIGLNGLRRYVSPAAQRLLGRAPDELVGQRFQSEVHENDLAAVEADLSPVQSGEMDEATVTYRARRADGTWIWLESRIRTIYDRLSDRRDGFVAISRDVTDRKRAEAEMARLASLDALTGIANRRTFDLTLSRNWASCGRAELPLSLLIVDVDRFKALNDSQGHQAGDECLRRIGATLATIVRRTSDLVARYGGEEFVLLLPDTDTAGAEAVAERLRAETEALAIPHQAGGLGNVVTVSVGAATLWPSPREQEQTAATLVHWADQCLYEAKRRGRNRVVHHATPGVLGGTVLEI